MMFWYFLGRRSGYRAATRGSSGQWGCGTVVAFALIIGAVVAFWQIAVPVVAIAVVVLIAAGARRSIS
ncbi:MAG TPA: hypothetical protein VH112_11055 [Acidimicrobiales bacterium]|jgi:hypothetical protein|nr:hypothetical protein [Acidimicrobiales bacterium]